MDLVFRQTVFVVIVGMIAPLVVICTTAVLTALLQAVTQVQEQSIGFLVKLLTLIGLLYLASPLIQRQMVQLTGSALQALVSVR